MSYSMCLNVLTPIHAYKNTLILFVVIRDMSVISPAAAACRLTH